MVDWNKHKWEAPVRCIFKPRTEHNGQPLKTGIAEIAGSEMLLQAMWQCDEDEKYPDEFALEGADDETRALLRSVDVGWIASGDVETPNPH